MTSLVKLDRFARLTDALEVRDYEEAKLIVMSQSFQAHKSGFPACPNLQLYVFCKFSFHVLAKGIPYSVVDLG